MRLACPHCHYDASAIVSNDRDTYTCPECGRTGRAARLRAPRSFAGSIAIACGPTLLFGPCIAVMAAADSAPLRALVQVVMFMTLGWALMAPVIMVIDRGSSTYERERSPAFSNAALLLCGLALNLLIVSMTVVAAINIGFGDRPF
ncbi:MAG: hypothetical protein AMXMBFR58_17750 [Phycisphaerae bacterium]|nr:hypothetical protein [Phycisphaerales bacterium]